MGASRKSLMASLAFLVTGNLIGAGILALPINTGLAGFIPSMGVCILVGLCMLFSARVIGDEVCETKQESFDLPSIYGKYLGPVGKWIAVVANLLILYGFLVAYITGSASSIGGLFKGGCSGAGLSLAVIVALCGITVCGMGVVKACNSILVLLLWTSFAVIALMAEFKIEPGRYLFMDLAFLPSTVPILVAAFHFHNLIPALCKELDWDVRSLNICMAAGMLMGFLMNAIWIQVGIGAIPLTGGMSIAASYAKGEPSTVPLAALIGSKLFTASALIFALIAIATSFFANGRALMNFMEDMTRNFLKLRGGASLAAALAFVPPAAIALVYPNIFLRALNIVGGFGIVTLFGIFPSIIAFRKARTAGWKAVSAICFALFTLFLIFEFAQEFGVLKLTPDMEYWNQLQNP